MKKEYTKEVKRFQKIAGLSKEVAEPEEEPEVEKDIDRDREKEKEEFSKWAYLDKKMDGWPLYEDDYTDPENAQSGDTDADRVG